MKLGRFNEKFEQKKYIKRGYRFLIKESIFDLTAREFEILFYIIRGKTAKEIAKFIGISFRTVEYHFNSLKYKLDCKTKNNIIEKAIAHGLINVIPALTFTDSFSYKSTCIS